MKTLISAYCHADELNVNEYGEAFFNELVCLVKDGKLSETDAVAIVDCLVDVDEIRRLLASGLRECIVRFVEVGEF